MTKIVVDGLKCVTDYEFFKNIVDKYIGTEKNIEIYCECGASGDAFFERYIKEHSFIGVNIKLPYYYKNGYIRNRLLLKYIETKAINDECILIVFGDGVYSRNLIHNAKKNSIETYSFQYGQSHCVNIERLEYV